MGALGKEIQASKRRVAMKRWLRARGIKCSQYEIYNETALRKLVRENLGAAPSTGGAHGQ